MYMQQHSLTSVTTLDFRYSWEYFVEREMDLSPEEINSLLGQIDFERWVNVPENAPVTPDFSTTESDESAALAQSYIDLGGDSSPANYADYLDWYSNLKVVFHTTLQANMDDVTEAILTKIDADLGCTDDVDPEVKQRWYATGILKGYDPVTEPAHTWVSSMGRSKYLNPIYQALEDSGQHDLGVQWFDENKDFYHPVAATTIEGILGITEASAPCDGCVNAVADNLLIQ